MATTDTVEKTDSHLAGRDDLRAEVHQAFVIHTRILAGMMVATAAVAVTIAELI